MAPQPATIQMLSDYVATGYWQESAYLAHSFDTVSSNVITVDLSGLTFEGKALARAALDAWEEVADLSFREMTSGAKITFDDSAAGAFSSASWTNAGSILSAYVNVSTDWLSSYGTSIGSYSFQTYMHEIGHALGLGHPGPYNGTASFETNAKFSNDSWQQTIMSYFSQDQNVSVGAHYAPAVTPMVADTLAIQKLYGAPQTGSTAGNTTYGMGSNLGTYMDEVFSTGAGHLRQNALTIYDRNGVDTINFSGDDQPQQVNLGAGKFSNVYGLTGNLGIANGTVIENYIAGAESDRVSGNAVANKLWLGAGNDVGFGLGGHDKLWGGGGNDKLFGGGDADVLKGGIGSDELRGDGGADHLRGNSGSDKLYGRAGNDTLVGGIGKDWAEGGAGDDYLQANKGSDTLLGGKGRDNLYGDAGNDRLDGGAGNDELSGGLGADIFVFGLGSGRDHVADMKLVDRLEIDAKLFTEAAPEAADLTAYASWTEGGLVLNFGNGDVLKLSDITDLDFAIRATEIA